jgi:4-amino-4-deoxy-L-arabinose transferase-like glycosyltransferase
MKYTQTTLDKLEAIPEQAGYVLRYERGTFQSGFCILESKKVVVLNKFLATEGRINTLIDLIPQLQIDLGHLSEESARLHQEVLSRVESAEKPD